MNVDEAPLLKSVFDAVTSEFIVITPLVAVNVDVAVSFDIEPNVCVPLPPVNVPPALTVIAYPDVTPLPKEQVDALQVKVPVTEVTPVTVRE